MFCRRVLPVVVLTQGSVLGLDGLVEWGPQQLLPIKSLPKSAIKYFNLVDFNIKLGYNLIPRSSHKAIAGGDNVDDVHWVSGGVLG